MWVAMNWQALLTTKATSRWVSVTYWKASTMLGYSLGSNKRVPSCCESVLPSRLGVCDVLNLVDLYMIRCLEYICVG